MDSEDDNIPPELFSREGYQPSTPNYWTGREGERKQLDSAIQDAAAARVANGETRFEKREKSNTFRRYLEEGGTPTGFHTGIEVH